MIFQYQMEGKPFKCVDAFVLLCICIYVVFVFIIVFYVESKAHK